MRRISVVLSLVVVGMTANGALLADTAPGGGFGNQQNLDTIKQRVEQRLQDTIAKLQASLTCVQNAQDKQSLRSCLPKHGQRRRGGNRMGPPGGQG